MALDLVRNDKITDKCKMGSLHRTHSLSIVSPHPNGLKS